MKRYTWQYDMGEEVFYAKLQAVTKRKKGFSAFLFSDKYTLRKKPSNRFILRHRQAWFGKRYSLPMKLHGKVTKTKNGIAVKATLQKSFLLYFVYSFYALWFAGMSAFFVFLIMALSPASIFAAVMLLFGILFVRKLSKANKPNEIINLMNDLG